MCYVSTPKSLTPVLLRECETVQQCIMGWLQMKQETLPTIPKSVCQGSFIDIQ